MPFEHPCESKHPNTTTSSSSTSTAMQAIVINKFGGPEVLQLSQGVQVPTVGPKQVLVKVISAGVNPVDTYIRQGAYATFPTRNRSAISPLTPTCPYIPGKDGAGVVARLGSLVTRFQEGDRVYMSMFCESGTYAEYSLFDEHSVQPLPEKLSFAQGASIGIPYYTAYRALILKAKAAASETVLVHGGSGAVGIAAIQMAKAYDMKVIATVGTEEGRKRVLDMGADHVFNHGKEGYMEEILQCTDDKGVDVILEMVANVNLTNDLTILKQHGRIVTVGSTGDISITPKLLMVQESAVIGVALASSTPSEWAATASAIANGIDKGWVNPIVGKEYSLQEAAQAHRDLVVPGSRGKLVITI